MRQPSTSPSVTLDRVLATRTPVLWPEAVAVLQATCDALAPADAPEIAAPDLPGIRVHADGTVSVSEGVPGEASAVRLARTLHALLPAQSTPAALRLLITKWTGAGEAHAIREFAAELAYFARPDGDRLIRTLYARAATAARATTAPPVTQPEIPEPPRTAATRAAVPKSLLAAAALLAALAAAGTWYAMQPPAATLEATEGSTDTSQVIETAEAAAATPTSGAASAPVRSTPVTPAAGGRTADIRLGQPRARGAAPASAASGNAAGRIPAAPLGDARLSAATSSAATPNAATLNGATTLMTVDPRLGPVPGLPAATPTPGMGGGGAPAAFPPSHVYSARDVGVDPPKLVYPQLPVPPDRPTPDIAINTMEVVVGPDGRVQTVQLISAPERMNDMMLLSAAKVWQFEPASLHGEPVRYRMRVSWAATR